MVNPYNVYREIRMSRSENLDMSILVSKANDLVKAHYKMTVVEHRLFNIALSKIRSNKITLDNNVPITISAHEYADLFSDTIDGGYKALRTAVDTLFERQFTLEREISNTKKHVRTYRFIQMKGYLEGEARIEIQFANDVLPFVSELANKFTQIDLQHTVDLSSQYANRLYEILKEVQNYKEQKVFLELDDLRSRFGIENKYKTMSNLKDNVLDLAVTQINKSKACDIYNLQYTNKKAGKKIIGFEFTYKIRKQPKKSDIAIQPIVLKMTDSQRYLFANKLSELAEMNKYSQGTESYSQFAVRIAEMLQDPLKIEELLPYLKKVGFNTK